MIYKFQLLLIRMNEINLIFCTYPNIIYIKNNIIIYITCKSSMHINYFYYGLFLVLNDSKVNFIIL